MNIVETIESWMTEVGWTRSSKEWADSPNADALEARFVCGNEIVGIRVYNSPTSAELVRLDVLEAARLSSLHRGNSVWWVEINQTDLYGKPKEVNVNRGHRGIF